MTRPHPALSWLLAPEPTTEELRERLLAHLVRAFRGNSHYTAYASRRVRDGLGHVVPDVVVRQKRGTVHVFRLAVGDPLNPESADRSWRPVADQAAALGARAWIVVPKVDRVRAEALLVQQSIPAFVGAFDAPHGGPIRFHWPSAESRSTAFR